MFTQDWWYKLVSSILLFVITQRWLFAVQLWISNFNSENFSFVVKILRRIQHVNYSRQPSTPKIIDTRLNIGPSVGMTSKPFEFSYV